MIRRPISQTMLKSNVIVSVPESMNAVPTSVLLPNGDQCLRHAKIAFIVAAVERCTSTSGRNLLPVWYLSSVTSWRLTWRALTCVTGIWRSLDDVAAGEPSKFITDATTTRNGTRLVREIRSKDAQKLTDGQLNLLCRTEPNTKLTSGN